MSDSTQMVMDVANESLAIAGKSGNKKTKNFESSIYLHTSLQKKYFYIYFKNENKSEFVCFFSIFDFFDT